MPDRSENPLLASGASSGLRVGLPVLAVIFNGIGCAYSEEDSGGCACRLEHGLRRLVFLCSNGLVLILVSASIQRGIQFIIKSCTGCALLFDFYNVEI